MWYIFPYRWTGSCSTNDQKELATGSRAFNFESGCQVSSSFSKFTCNYNMFTLPERRCYDITVTDRSNATICSFFGLWVQKHSRIFGPKRLSEPGYDYIFQPVSNYGQLPNITPTFERPNRLEERQLFHTLDGLARAIIISSMQGQVTVGSKVSLETSRS